MAIDRREMLTGLAASAMAAGQGGSVTKHNSYLELQVWRLHNSAENQTGRVSEFLSHGLGPALERAGSHLIGAFANVIGNDGPFYVTLVSHGSLGAMQKTLETLASDSRYQAAVEQMSNGNGLPFVRLDGSILRSFDAMPEPAVEKVLPPRVFELRTYESQSFAGLSRKVAMFNESEAGIFKRLGFRPVFFGETIAGPSQPNLKYMLSYKDLADRDRLWGEFGTDPEWQKLRSRPGLSDNEIVANISNVILRPLPFSAIS
jgi:hypothetical protein